MQHAEHTLTERICFVVEPATAKFPEIATAAANASLDRGASRARIESSRHATVALPTALRYVQMTACPWHVGYQENRPRVHSG
jgi:hypothetical protein